MINETRIGILSVDDHPLFREGIATVIKNQPDMLLVAEAASGAQALQRFREHRPDVTLMDLRLPDMSGMEAIIAIRSEFANARIIMLTTFEGDISIQRALEAGASGYLLKCLPSLLKRVRRLKASLNRPELRPILPIRYNRRSGGA